MKSEDMTKIEEFLKKAESIVVLTGAGISAESGVPTFRGEDGLWKNYRAEELATPYAFEKNPSLVWEWYNWRRELIAPLKPNDGHLAIAQLERLFEDFLLITQNIDGIHQQAGSKKMLELHGNIWKVRCTREGRVFELKDTPLKDIPPRCDCGALLRPHVVWFGESLEKDIMDKSVYAIERCDLFFSVGTSAVVQPAASFALMAKQRGAFVVEVNLDPTPISNSVDISLLGKAGEILPEIVDLAKKLKKN
ncbi:MAG: NAD-dependent deacylase [Candidatus Schekmanbacteria bacterium]|nr:MAG: NAD-dependent deacylase [Candidatus Schekmanbacteria bacterium]